MSLKADNHERLPIGTLSNRIVDHFTYTRRNSNEMENGNEDVQWEFLVIGRRVLWNEAQAICSIYGHLNPLSVSEKEEMEYDNSLDLLTRETKTDTGSTLAVLDDNTKDWLARMISESDYRSFDYFTFRFFKFLYIYIKQSSCVLESSIL